MAIPTVVAVGTVANGIGDITPGLPAGTTADDILLAFIECSNADTISTPSGWAHVTGSPLTGGAATATQLGVLWKRAGASESAPTFTDAGDHQVGRILGVRGCVTTGDPWDVIATGTAGTGTAVSIPGATTTVADCLVVAIVANGRDVATTANVSGWTNADLSSLTEQIDNWVDDGNGGGIAVATGGKATAGAYAATTATLAGGAGTQALMSVALKPATGSTAHTKSLDDTITASDAVGKASGKATADTLTANDATGKGVASAQADTLTASDATVKVIGLGKADTLTASDALARVWDAKLTVVDALTTTDAVAKGISRPLADALALSDSSNVVAAPFSRPWTYGGTATFTYTHAQDWTYTPVTG